MADAPSRDPHRFAMRRMPLRFPDPAVERAFRHSYFLANLQVSRIGHLIAIVFYALFAFWDMAVSSPERAAAWVPILGVVTLVFLAGLLASYRAKSVYARFWQPFFALYVLLTGLGFSVITTVGRPTFESYDTFGIIVCLIFCYTFIRLTLTWAVPAGSLVILVYAWAHGRIPHPHEAMLATEIFVLVGVNILGMIVCYSVEYLSRRDFMLNELLREAEERTRQRNVFLEAQLIQAQKMESIGRLAGGVAHDYNNITSVVMGFSELALDRVEVNDPLREDLEEIQKAAVRSTELTSQLLAFARKQTVAPKVLDLNENVARSLKMLQRLIGEDIDLAWIPDPNAANVKIDPTQLDQLLANLCVNARDAIVDTGKITIETANAVFDPAYCEQHLGFRPGEYVLLAVSDDGCGIPDEEQDKIFEPFFTTKEVGRGTGLGLATVYGIVKQNDGFLNLYSERGRGTTFKIYLPRHEAGTAIPADDALAEVPRGRGETVLLVEDHMPILELGRRVLEELGYEVLSAPSPDRALELAASRAAPVDILVTDVVMPGMNGRELAVRLLNRNPELRVLYMSGYTANVIAHHGVLDEGVHFLHKPFSKSDLGLGIRRALDAGAASPS